MSRIAPAAAAWAPACAQVVGDQAEVGEQLIPAEVDARRRRLGASPVQAGARASDVIRGSCGAWRRSSGTSPGRARGRRGRATSGKSAASFASDATQGLAGLDEAVGVAEPPPEVVDPLEVVAEQALLLEPDRLGGGEGRDAGVAVAVAADPRAEPEEGGAPPFAVGIDPRRGPPRAFR